MCIINIFLTMLIIILTLILLCDTTYIVSNYTNYKTDYGQNINNPMFNLKPYTIPDHYEIST